MDKSYMLFDGKREFDPGNFECTAESPGLNKKTAAPVIAENIEKMICLQDRLYAHNKDAVLLIFQAMDAGGKDGMIKHVMKGVNPQGTEVTSFKQPSREELDHDYMWRYFKNLPERGRIGIFNRSYYEDVLIARVHGLPEKQGSLPDRCMYPDLWKRRLRQIRDFERYLDENGVLVLKFFLNLSKEEQRKRFLKRIETADKNWKFSSADINERKYWDEYMDVYKKTINDTATGYAPWHVIPADCKWYARLAVSEFIVEALEKIDPKYPALSDNEAARLAECRQMLLNEAR